VGTACWRTTWARAQSLAAIGAVLGVGGCGPSLLMPISPPSEILPETQPLSAATGPPLRASYAAAMKLADVEPGMSPAQPAASGVTETLQEALSSAYLTNPDLNAERAQLRATDEQVGVAKAGFRPTISASADTGYADTNNGVAKGSTIGQENFGTTGDISSDGVTHPRGLSVQLSQPLFKGFQNLNATRQAKASVQAGREGLNVIEQMTLLAAVTAYADVVRDQAIVRLRENNVTVLTALRTQIRGQFAAGIVTTTDVAQVEARLSGATAFLNAAQSDLRGSIATYEQVIGHPPGRLASPPSISKTLPKSIDEAMTQADGQNPLVLNSVYQEEASLYAVNQIVGELLPTVTLEAQYQHRGDLSNVLEEQEATTVIGRVNVPLYQGGGVAARVRQAKQINTKRKRLVESARLKAHSEVVSNWGILQSSAGEIASAKAAVAANRTALEGSRKEQEIGQRSTLDVLDTQRDLVDSQIGLVVALRNRIVAEYALAAAVGRLDAQSLGLSTPYYDPIEHYDDVKNKWAGLRPPPPPSADE